MRPLAEKGSSTCPNDQTRDSGQLSDLHAMMAALLQKKIPPDEVDVRLRPRLASLG